MKLTQNHRHLLRSLQHRPRDARDFTHGYAPIAHPTAILQWLTALVNAGYATVNGRRLYAITELGEKALVNQPEITPSRVYCTASVTEPYVPKEWAVRPGALDNKQFKTFGTPT